MDNFINISLLIIIFIFGYYHVYKNYRNFDLLEIFVISYILFFDVYTLLNIIDGVNKFKNEFIFLFTLFIVFSSLLLFLFLFKIFINKKLRLLMTYQEFIKHANYVSINTIFALFISIAIVIGYYFLQFHLFGNVYTYNNKIILNGYGIILSSFLLPLFYLIISVSMIKYLNSKKYNKIIFLLNGIIFLILFSYTRRAFFEAILLTITLYAYVKNFNIASIKSKNIILLILVGFMFIVGSNLFQNIRGNYTKFAIGKFHYKKPSILKMMFDFKISEQDLKARQSLFSLDYNVVKKMVYSKKKPLLGKIILQSVINIIPRIIYPDKRVITDNNIIANHFNLKRTDYPINIILEFIACFGLIASIIIYPIFMMVYLVFFIFLLKVFKKNNLSFIIIFIVLYDVLFNVQMPLEYLWVSIRNIFIFIFIFQSISFLKKIVHSTHKTIINQ